jgi:hypothetical protein
VTERARFPVPVPTLAELEADPSAFDALPRQAQDALLEEAAVLAARLGAKVMARQAGERPPAEPDRAVAVAEACRLLAMTEDYVYRHWAKLGGYKDDDGHVKFPMSSIQRHLRRHK